METMRFIDKPLNEIPVDINEVFILMGYGEHTPPQDIIDMINEMLDELQSICIPHYGYRLFEGEEIDREHLRVSNIILNPGRIITSAMREVEQYAIFTSTVGQGFDKWFKQLKDEDDIVRTFIANTLGSVLAESTVSVLMKELEEAAAAEGLRITNNYSPGYCDWVLIEQKKIFSLFPDEITGIKLTDSCLMLPIKSVSGIIGVGANAKKRPYGCAICNMTSCIKNMKKQKAN